MSEQIALKPHQELRADGEVQGRDPRQMTPEGLAACGLTRISRGDAIRAKCLSCCCGSPSEVRRCGAVDCPLWSMRMGNDPWREARELTDEQRKAGAERLRQARQARSGTGTTVSLW